MGLLDRFKKKEIDVQESVETLDVDISNLSEWVSTTFSSEIFEAKASAFTLYDHVVSSFDDIKSAISDLEKTTFESNDKIYTRVNMIKETFVNKANSLIKTEKLKEEITYGELKNFYLNVMQNIKELKGASPKQAILLSNYFKEQSGKFIDAVKNTEKKLDDLNKFLDAKGKMIWVAHKTEELSKKQESDINQYTRLSDDITSNDDKIKDAEEDIENKNKKLEELISGDLWQDLKKRIAETEQLKAKKSEVSSEIIDQLNVINRPLKKELHASEDTLVKAFIEDPMRALLEEDGPKQLQDILNGLSRKASKGEVTLKDKEQEKILDLIRKLGYDIPVKIKNYVKIRENIKAKTKETEKLSPGLMKEKVSLEEQIDESNKDIEKLRKDIVQFTEEKKTLKHVIERQKQELEKIISSNTPKRVNLKQIV
ncbi:MAG: hypothetical protein ABIJ92_03515 [Candidatus Aenigmatarchaeota archaeon]